MYSPAPLVDTRRASYARLASRVLEALNEAVSRRIGEGRSKAEIAERIGCHRSQLSRVLNGTTPNLTLRTISDVLWATDFDPQDFAVDPLEELSQNCRTFESGDTEYRDLWTKFGNSPELHGKFIKSDWPEKTKINSAWKVEVAA